MLNTSSCLRNGEAKRHRGRPLCLLASVCLLLGLAGGALAVTPETGEMPPAPPWLEDELPEQFEPGTPWCRYPLARPGKSGVTHRAAELLVVDEAEPNDLLTEAQFLAISSTVEAEIDLEVTGTIAPGADLDFYRITVRKGDVIGLAVLADEPLDPIVGIFELNGAPLIANDDHRGIAGIYPTESPFSGGEQALDSALTWIAPADGDYLVRVASFASASNGEYSLSVIARRPAFEHRGVGATQILFIDFDGVDDLNAVAAFGYGAFTTRLSPMRAFLANWGLTPEDEADVVQAIMDVVQENFDDLRTPSLNGDRDVDFVDGHFDVELRNSRDHADPWGQLNVSRVIVGGTIPELRIPTLGIAESIDPGNFGREETAVVLLDLLSEPNPAYLDSVNSLQLAPGVSIVEAVGEVVGNIVTHEAGHFLGLWHTDNMNEVQCLIDQGGDGIYNEAGVGPDGVFGTADDADMDFVPDEYIANEAVAVGLERTNVRTAFAMATGKRLDIEPPPPPPDPEVARASIQASPLVGQAPLAVQLAGGGIDPEGGQFLVFNWSFGDGTTGSGPLVNHVYSSPGNYLVRLTATTDSAQTAGATIQIVVLSAANRPPDARIAATPERGTVPLVVIFEADASDDDGAIVDYAWDFGDGTTGSGRIAEHVYVDIGIYVVTLTVTDDRGALKSDTKVVTATATSLDSLTAALTVPENNAAQPMPLLPTCGAGTSGAIAATLALMMGLTLIRRRW